MVVYGWVNLFMALVFLLTATLYTDILFFTDFLCFHVVVCMYWGYCVRVGYRVRLEIVELMTGLRPT